MMEASITHMKYELPNYGLSSLWKEENVNSQSPVGADFKISVLRKLCGPCSAKKHSWHR